MNLIKASRDQNATIIKDAVANGAHEMTFDYINAQGKRSTQTVHLQPEGENVDLHQEDKVTFPCIKGGSCAHFKTFWIAFIENPRFFRCRA